MIKTITLTGSETVVSGLDGANCAIRNDGTDTIYAAKSAGITAGADGVLSIPAGQSAVLWGIVGGTAYLLGTGSAMLISSDYNENPFRNSAASGGSGADDIQITATRFNNGTTYTNRFNYGLQSWYGWRNVSDGGNAASIGAYTEAKLAEMEARIEALEGGTT